MTWSQRRLSCLAGTGLKTVPSNAITHLWTRVPGSHAALVWRIHQLFRTLLRVRSSAVHFSKSGDIISSVVRRAVFFHHQGEIPPGTVRETSVNGSGIAALSLRPFVYPQCTDP